MFSKKTSLLAFVFVFLGCASGAAGQGGSEVVDCVAARVNDEILTLTDIRIIQAFGLGSEKAFQPASMDLRACLEAAIHRQVVLALVPVNIPILDKEIEEMRQSLRRKFKGNEWERQLREFGLEEGDLDPYLKQILHYEKIIDLRFSQTVEVSLGEIESYYQSVYRPQQEARGEQPLPLVQVIDDLESRIRREKTEKRVLLWIQSLRQQADVWTNDECLRQGFLKEEEW